MTKIDWIAVDWGTSNLRIWAMANHSDVVDEIYSPQGMAGLAPNEFETVLLSHIGKWLGDTKIPIIACGMVGAKQGWVEAPYDKIPCLPAGKTIIAPTHDARFEMRIISGICQMNPPDVMRGEETQIADFLADNPHYSGVLCLPGTHSKWVELTLGKITSLQTAMTGELFALLSKQSILRDSLGEQDDDCFIGAVQAIVTNPEKTIIRLFNIRAVNLLYDDKNGVSHLAGGLIGSELAGMKTLWQSASGVTLIGANELTRLYQKALNAYNVNTTIIDGNALVLKGLQQTYEKYYR